MNLLLLGLRNCYLLYLMILRLTTPMPLNSLKFLRL